MSSPQHNAMYSIAKKILMSITGLFLILYLCIHLGGNLMILFGKEFFNNYAETLGGNPLIWGVEVILFTAIILHIIDGIYLYFQNRSARGTSYRKFNVSGKASRAGHRMAITGLIVLIFLILHVKVFFVDHKLLGVDNLTLYDREVATFSNIWVVLFYVFAMIFVGFHVYHGFLSGFRTIGLSNKNHSNTIKGIGAFLAIVFAVGFSFLPLYVYFVLAN